MRTLITIGMLLLSCAAHAEDAGAVSMPLRIVPDIIGQSMEPSAPNTAASAEAPQLLIAPAPQRAAEAPTPVPPLAQIQVAGAS